MVRMVDIGAGISLLLVSLFAAGCSKTYYVGVDSIRDNSFAQKNTYVLHCDVPDVSDNDLLFQEIAACIRRGMNARGYTEAEPNQVDLIVLVDYGITDTQVHQEVYSTPIYGHTGGMGYYRTGPHGKRGRARRAHVYASSRCDIIGVETYATTYASHLNFLILTAYQADVFLESQQEDAIPVWRTTITIRDTAHDLRMALPTMIGAAYEHIGTNTNRRITVKIKPDDQRVKFIKGDTFEPDT